MSLIAKQSTAIIVTVGPVLDASGVAVTDGVVADFKISKNGGAPAALNGSATLTHRHTGFYSLSLTATDVNTVGTAEITIDDTVNSCGMKEITVIEGAVYDALFADAATGMLPANVVQISGDATAADNAESFFDGAGYAGTNNVIPTVTTVTNLTNAPTSGDLTATMKTSVTTAATAATPIVDVGAINGDATAAANLALSAGVMIQGTVSSAVLSPTTSAFAADDITEATPDHYLGRSLIFTSGALRGEGTRITGYSLVSAEGNFAVVALTEAPANDDTFIIV